MGLWIVREALSLSAIAGAALTVLGMLATAGALSPGLGAVLTLWPDLLGWLWRPLLAALGVMFHPHLVAALSFAGFAATMGLGARVSAWLEGNPLPPLNQGRFLDGQTMPSLAIFAALNMIFLFGGGNDPADDPDLVLFGSREAGRYLFAITVTAGYAAGDYLGHDRFHESLYRLATVVGVIWLIDAIKWGLAG